MVSDKRTAYVLSLAFLVILLTYFFVPIASNALLPAIIVLLFAVLSVLLIKKNDILSIFKNQVLLLMVVIAFIYVMLYYITGLHFGFYLKSGYGFFKAVGNVLPTVLLIVSSEFIRRGFCAQKYKVPTVIVFFCLVLAEVMLKYNFAKLANFNRFMDFLGLSLFPAVFFNLLYHYIAKNYGILPNIMYRLITAVLMAVVPYGSSISDSLFSLFGLLYPLIVYAFIKVLYEKKKREKKKVSKGVGIATFSVVLALLIGLIMLVSCQFKYCAIVIATESMTGELNKGDVTIYQRYEGQELEEGTIIVFDKGDGTTVHRIVKIEVVDGTIRYTTKGDANDGNDLGYVYKEEIKGTTLFKVAYFGYPTLWLRSLFRRA